MKKRTTERRVFRVVFKPDDGGWHVTVPEVKGCHTWGRTLEAGRRHVREALACALLDLPEAEAARVAEEATLDEDIRLPAAVDKAIARSVTAREAAAREAKVSADAAREAARGLTQCGLSRRDTADLLGLSHQRIQQLLA